MDKIDERVNTMVTPIHLAMDEPNLKMNEPNLKMHESDEKSKDSNQASLDFDIFSVLAPAQSNPDDPIKELVRKYLKDDGGTFGESVKHYLEPHVAGNVLLAIFDLKTGESPTWTTLGCVKNKNSAKIYLGRNLPDQNDLSRLQKALSTNLPHFKFEVVVVNLTVNADIYERGSISDAVRNVRVLLHTVDSQHLTNNDAPASNQIAFEKIIVEEGLKMDFKTKKSLGKIIASFKNLIKHDPLYQLPEDLLGNLVKVLTKRNFQPRGDEDVDFLYETIKLTKELKLRGQELGEYQNTINEYFAKNADKFSGDVQSFDELLKNKNTTNVDPKACLILAINNRVEFLHNLMDLAPEQLELTQLEGILQIFSEPGKETALKQEEEQLLRQLKALNDEIKQSRASINIITLVEVLREVDRKFEAAKTLDAKITEIQTELVYRRKKCEVSEESKLRDVLGFIAEKIWENCLKQETLDTIFEMGIALPTEPVGVAILKIANASPNADMSKFPHNVIPHISQAQTLDVLLFAERGNQSEHVSRFLQTILFENESYEVRQRALKICQNSGGLPKDVKATIELESEIEKSKNIPKACLKHICKKRPLTLNCFESLERHLGAQEVSEIVQKIVENDLQKLPKRFVDASKQFLQSHFEKAQDPHVVKLAKALLIGQILSLDDASKALEQIGCTDEKIADEVLSIVLIASGQGLNVPEGLIKKIQAFPESEKVVRVLKTIKNAAETDVDVLNNPRRSLDERLASLRKIHEDPNYHDAFTVGTLQTLIRFEPDLREKLLETLAHILAHKASIQVNSAQIAKHICSGVISERMLKHFYQLIQSDVGPILDMLIYTIFENFQLQPLAANLLKQLACSERPKGAMIARKDSILEAFLHVADPDVKNTLLDVMKRLELTFEIRTAEGNFLTKGAIQSLIANLDTLKGINSQQQAKVLDLLLQVSLQQGLPNESFANLFDILARNFANFLGIPSMFALLIQGHSLKSAAIPNEILESVWKLLDSDPNESNSLKFVMLTGEIVPERVLLRIAPILAEQDEYLDKRLCVAQIISKQAALPRLVVENLENAAFTTVTCEGDLALVRFCFEILGTRLPTPGGTPERALLKSYFESLMKNFGLRLDHTSVANDDAQRKLQMYVENFAPISEVYLTLLTLTNAFILGQNFDASRHIFHDFNERDWCRELLTSELLLRSTATTKVEGTWQGNVENSTEQVENSTEQIENSPEKFENSTGENNKHTEENSEGSTEMAGNVQIDDLTVCGYFENIRNLNSFIEANQSGHLQTTNVLKKLISKQIAHQLDLKSINEVLQLLTSDANNLQKDFVDDVIDMREAWLAKKLSGCGIEFTKNDLSELNQLLPYSLFTLGEFFGKVNKNSTNLAELRQFFKMLDVINLGLEEKEDFLLRVRCVSNAYFVLCEKVTGLIFSNMIAYYTRNMENKCDKGDKKNERTNKANTEAKVNLEILRAKLAKMLMLGWNIESIVQFLQKRLHLDKIGCSPEDLESNYTSGEIEQLAESLDPIYEYKLREYDSDIMGRSLLSLLETCDLHHLQKKVHQLAIHQTFPGTYNKDVRQLQKELVESNKGANIQFLLNDAHIDEYQRVVEFYHSEKSALLPGSDVISEWKQADVKDWARLLKLRAGVTLTEKVSVVIRAVELVKKYPPRPIQVFSLLCSLRNDSKGRLMQINTGEGKTTIIAMFAAIKALEGNTVDVITSSPELANPQSVEQGDFYAIFGLSVAHNSPDSPIGVKTRYKADVVYGAAGNFQGDILRDEYSKLGTLNGRKCQVAVVDEVDSMLIDGKNHIVMLSTPMPAMNHLEVALAAIFLQIDAVVSCLLESNNKVYFVQATDAFEGDGTLKKDFVQQASPIACPKAEFIRRCTEIHLRKMLHDPENLKKLDATAEIDASYPEIKIPAHLREFVLKVQLKEWIDRAIHAKFHSDKGKHYILKDGKIAPVDATNTGVVQKNMHWNCGLHQFLQIKHGAKITPESLTTNYISNVAYFRRYKDQIYGLTGTLGSQNARELLEETYHVDSLVVPPFKLKQHREISPIISKTAQEWYQNIVGSCLSKLKNKRGALIITKYIEETERIVAEFQMRKYDLSKIKTYKTEADSDVVKRELQVGEVIVATNIAGRGTDIKTSPQMEENGGLHVCVTFLPLNERVEQQNVGRTSRTGNKGTSQFVVFSDQPSFETLRKVRNFEEEQSLRNARIEIERVTRKDEVFGLFCALLTEIRETYGPKNSTKDIYFQNINATPLGRLDNIETVIKAVEERFGIWLQLQKDLINDGGKEEVPAEFAKFKAEILEDLKHPDRVIKNPYFFVLDGNQRLQSKRYPTAVEKFTKAIDLDPNFAEFAYYSRGIARLAQYGNTSNRNQIDSAVEDFKAARRTIEERICELQLIQKASSGEAISEQVAHKMTLFSMQKNIIEHAIGLDRESVNKEIDRLTKIKEKHSETLKKLKEETMESSTGSKETIATKENEESSKKLKGSGDTSTEINDSPSAKLQEQIEKIGTEISNLREDLRVRGNGGVVGKALRDGHGIKLELTGLEKSLPDGEDANLYKDELDEFKTNGYIGAFEVSAIKPIDWKSVIGLALLGLAQLVAGGAIAVFTMGAGSSLGMGLISEGVADLITAVKDGIINRDFSWVSWGIQKAISITISVVCAGLSAIKDVAKTAVAGAKQLGSTVLNQTVKQGWKIAAKAIGTGLAKGVAKELVTDLIDYGIDKTLIPCIEGEVFKLIEGPLQEALLNNEDVRKMLELDERNRNNKYGALVKQKAFELLAASTRNSAFYTIAEGIAKGIATNKIKGLSTALQITEALKNLAEISVFLFEYIAKLKEALAKLAKNEKIDEKIRKLGEESGNTNKLDDKANIGKSDRGKTERVKFGKGKLETAKVKGGKGMVSEDEPEESVFAQNYQVNSEGTGDIDLSKAQSEEEQVHLARAVRNPADLGAAIVSKVSTHMTSLIKGKLISPLAHMGVNYTMTNLTSELDTYIAGEIGNYQAERRIEFFQDGDPDNRIGDEFKAGLQDEEAASKAEEMIDDMREGGEAGLPHLGPISESIDRPIKVLDKKGRLVRVIGKDKPGDPVEVQYHEGVGGEPGHWTLPNNTEPHAQDTGRNNCLFNVISHQTGVEPNQLRQSTAGAMERNKGTLANQARDVARLERYKKDALSLGGARYGGKSMRDAMKIINKSQGVSGHNQPAKGHPKAHVNNPMLGPAPNKSQEEIKNIQKYSSKTKPQYPKTGFVNQKQQNDLVNRALRHPDSQKAMDRLNLGSDREKVTIPLKDLDVTRTEKMHTWCQDPSNKSQGMFVQRQPMNNVTLWLQHQRNQQNNPDADVHLFTCYPN